MDEEKPKRVSSFGVEYYSVEKLFNRQDYYYRVFDKEGTIVTSEPFDDKELRKAGLARLRKVLRNRFLPVKEKS